tara:strand:- start:476 stop:1471 length:996 start_codon:yes stop_codon:yes gene_type:complete
MEIKTIIIPIFIILNLLIIIFSEKLITLFNIYDFPDSKRKFHMKKTSLFGGTIILLNFLLYLILNLFFENNLVSEINMGLLFTGLILFYSLGLVDDKKDLNSNLKFFLEIMIIGFLIYFDQNILIEKLYFTSFDLTINLGKYSYIFTILSIIIFLNALNMYDGINLQAGIYSLIVLLTLLLFSKEYYIITILCLSLITFLYLNYKSKIFLGDSGTYSLGFLISYLIITTAKVGNYNILSADKIFILMMLPGLELIRLFITRLIAKRHPFSSDRNHIHHILSKKFNHIKTISILTLLIVFPLIFVFYFENKLHYMIIAFILIYISIIKRYEK